MTEITVEALVDALKRRKEVLDAYDEGRSIVVNCTLGFMFHITQRDGNTVLEARPDATPIRGEAEAEHVRKVIKSWSAALAVYDNTNKG